MTRALLAKKYLRVGDEIGPNGRKICRYINCNKEITGKRRNWCSDECVHEYRLLSHWSYTRQHVRKRDKCVCQACGANTRKLKSEIMKHWKEAVLIGRSRRNESNLYKHQNYLLLNTEYSKVALELTESGYHGFLTELPKSWKPRKNWKEPKDLWEADHILPVHLGGENHLENLRTLCHPCHKILTKAQARNRSQKRKPSPA